MNKISAAQFRIRNIGIIAHIDAGKTTVTERFLYYTHVIHRMGEVHDGQAVMDWMPQEQERGITITSAVTTMHWNNYELHLIDTPGHVDFTVEVERSLRVLDGVVMVLCAVGGVQPQSEAVWRQADNYGIPRIVFVNKMDRVGADYEACVAQLVHRLDACPLLLQIPLGCGDSFVGIIDLVTMQAKHWVGDDFGASYETFSIPPDLISAATKAREKLIETLADESDEIAELFLSNNEVPSKLIRATVRKMCVANKGVPILCGSALRNKGIQPLLNAVCDFLPSPIELPPVQGINPFNEEKISFQRDKNAPFAGVAFKVQLWEGRKHTYLRIYSGSLSATDIVYNANKDAQEKIGRLLKLHADKKQRIQHANAGDIVGVLGFKKTTTGDTLCTREHPVVFGQMKFTTPVISMAVEPKVSRDEEKLKDVLTKMVEEDPTFTVRQDSETGQTLLSGMGELHLDIIIDRLKREFRIPVNIGKPQVVYRETLVKQAEVSVCFEHAFEQGTKSKHVFARVTLRGKPIKRGTGIIFTNDFLKRVPDSASLPEEWFQAVESSIRESAETGPKTGYPIVDIEVTLVDLEFREGQTDTLSLHVASASAFKKLCEQGETKPLLPIMSLEVVTPEEFTGTVIGNLNSKGGIIEQLLVKGNRSVILCKVPMTKMFGYSTELRSSTQGRGTFTMTFHKFDIV